MNMTKFQLVLLIACGAAIVVGVMFFSLSRGGGNQKTNLVVWGTVPQIVFNNWYSASDAFSDERFTLQYTEIKEQEFDREFVDAVAQGRGPDLVLAPHERILRNQVLLSPIPFESFKERDFRDMYIDAASVLITSQGILGFPVAIDPLVLYWNKDRLSAANIISPPEYWEDVRAMVPKLLQKDGAGNIQRVGMGIGESTNIENAKDFFSMLVMQAGGTLISRDTRGYFSTLNSATQDQTLVPTTAALIFYTEFANPTKEIYTWNRSLKSSRTMFTAGDNAMYIGFASELPRIRELNPNLNFDVARVPQARLTRPRPLTFGRMMVVALPRSTPNTTSAFYAAMALTSKNSSLRYGENVAPIPPARKDALRERPNDPFMDLFFKSAVIASAWPDVIPEESKASIESMISAITSGRLRVEESVNRAQSEMDRAIREVLRTGP